MDRELVVFDMAGTTVSDNGNVNQFFLNAFASEGIIISASAINKVMGYRKIEAVEKVLVQYAPFLGELHDKTKHSIHDKFTADMVAFYQEEETVQPLPFAETLFQLLQSRGIKVALNTGFTRIITDAILAKLNWQHNPFINVTLSSDEVPEGRPHPFMIHTIMSQLGITDVSKVVKVGDTEVDIEEGRNAGCGLVVSVTTGSYSRKALAQFAPDYIIDSLQEFPALIH